MSYLAGLIRKLRLARAARHLYSASLYASDLTDEDRAFVLRYRGSYTMTSTERLLALRDAVRYIVHAGIPGDIAECGVWRGGNLMAAAETLTALGESKRTLWGYDTFTGMPEPGADRDAFGVSAREHAARHGSGGPGWQAASEAEVSANLVETGYARFRLIAGRVEATIPEHAPNRLALLRLDTDWHDSTKHTLTHLYPRLSAGGVLIIDDYGYWDGARKAVDDYFREQPVFLARVDSTGRLVVKR